MAANDVEAGRAYVTLYLRRSQYDGQVRDLGRETQQTPRPSQAVSNTSEDRESLHSIAKLIGYQGDIGNVRGHLQLLRDTTLSLSPALNIMGTAASGAAPRVTKL